MTSLGKLSTLLFPGICLITGLMAQPSTYVDEKGVMRWTETREEVCAFGVNYSEPFSSWREHELLGVAHEKAIDADVYHLARMGLDGYRIHVWETYICDYDGNLIFNKHLQLFDYLLYKLKERNFKIFITPMNFYGGSSSGFINKYGGKKGCLTDTTSFPAQENYLAQFVSHVNPYTGIAYKDDPNIIGFEICNEPFNHGDRPDLTTYYINRMSGAIRSTGCEKPIFYNVTHNIDQIDNFCADDIVGGTFQWYPTGLVADHDQKGNMLPNVDQYPIPFDEHPKFRNMARVVYELSPADVGTSSHLYPAMARSFREAGVQFAAQFAYDPMHVADVNLEYKTHFVSLPYAPKRSMGMVIASEVFHRVPLRKSFGRYPDNTSFDVFRVSYEDDLAEMVTDEKFLYTNNTTTTPPDPGKLQQVAGTGTSPVVNYNGTGAYFLDRLGEGVWRLEVMPDVLWVGDPHFSTNLNKEVSVVRWKEWPMTITLPDLGNGFCISGLNEGNDAKLVAEGYTFPVNPGAYLLTRAGKTSGWDRDDTWKNIRLGEFHAPMGWSGKTYVVHEPPRGVTAGSHLDLTASIVSPDEPDQVELILVGQGRRRITVPMEKSGAFGYHTKVPDEYIKYPGYLDYYITLRHGDRYLTFPSGYESRLSYQSMGRGTDWNFLPVPPWQVSIVPADDPVCLFDALKDFKQITKPMREMQYGLTPSSVSGEALMVIDLNSLLVKGANVDMANQTMEGDHSLRTYCREKITCRKEDLKTKRGIALYGHSLHGKSCKVQLALIMQDGMAYGGVLDIGVDEGLYTLSLDHLIKVRTVLLPRPYPTFLPYWFEMNLGGNLDLKEVESIQISIGPGIPENEYGQRHGVAIGKIMLL